MNSTFKHSISFLFFSLFWYWINHWGTPSFCLCRTRNHRWFEVVWICVRSVVWSSDYRFSPSPLIRRVRGRLIQQPKKKSIFWISLAKSQTLDLRSLWGETVFAGGLQISLHTFYLLFKNLCGHVVVAVDWSSTIPFFSFVNPRLSTPCLVVKGPHSCRVFHF